MKSCARFLEFMKRSNAVSPTVALETAAALQVMMSICIAKCSIWN
jgi:vacuolar protein sorting-associated protein 13A/C